jgi:hypothetical protein
MVIVSGHTLLRTPSGAVFASAFSGGPAKPVHKRLKDDSDNALSFCAVCRFMQQRMPRFFYHLYSDEGVSRDAVGIVFPDEDGAILEAVRAARHLLRSPAEAGTNWTGWRLEVADENGRRVYRLDLTDLARRLSHKGSGALKDKGTG